MHPLATWKTWALLAVLLTASVQAAPDPGFDDVDGPNVRVTRHADGSRTRFTRSADKTELTKKKYSPNGRITMVTVYVMDKMGNPLSCKIYDGKESLMYKVRYGYRKSDGKLVEEQMFDARVKRTDPATGKEMPVQRVLYVYDAQGNRSAPMVYNLLPGKTFEEVFGEKASMYDRDPFLGHGQPLNR